MAFELFTIVYSCDCCVQSLSSVQYLFEDTILNRHCTTWVDVLCSSIV